MKTTRLLAALAAGLAFASCRDAPKPATAKPAPAPAPIRPLGASESAPSSTPTTSDEEVFRVRPYASGGPALPARAVAVRVDGETWTSGGAPLDLARVKGQPVLLSFSPDTYLAQVAAWFARLDDAGLAVHLKHPDLDVAYPVELRDEKAFQAWLDDPVPGKLRIIQRADGFELQTNVGKLAGPDPNGPTVPLRGGQFDLWNLHQGLEKIRGRFPEAPDLCLVPSFGMELHAVIRAMGANQPADSSALFPSWCLVYPRPGKGAL
jgi:hypothetical protein